MNRSPNAQLDQERLVVRIETLQFTLDRMGEEIERLSGKQVQLVAATATDIRATLQAYLPTANVFDIGEINGYVVVEVFSVVMQAAFYLSDMD